MHIYENDFIQRKNRIQAMDFIAKSRRVRRAT